MIRNYFIIALRNIRRYSAHSIINISGMAIGMASAFLILMWVHDELSYDRNFRNANDLYRVIEKQYHSDGQVSELAIAPSPLAPFLKNEVPEILRSSRFASSPLTLKKGDDFVEEIVAAVDKDFVKMFDIEFVKGDINSALNDPHNIVFTEEMAIKYFGNEDAIGKTLQSRGYVVTVTGIVKNLPHNSHLHFNFLVPMEWLKGIGSPLNEWGARDLTYIELKKGTDSKIIDHKIKDFVKKHQQGSDSEIFLQNIRKIHLYSSRKYLYDTSDHGDITNVSILSLIALFILIIACINFINLSTAQSIRRSREIGIRKVSGAGRQKIIFQFLTESVLIVLISFGIAMVLVLLLLPFFNNLTGKQLELSSQSAGLWSVLVAIALLCGLLSGSYAALYISSLEPLDTLKGEIFLNKGNTHFRRGLVIFQFSLSILLIIFTINVGRQLKYLQTKELGFNRNNIGYFMYPIRPGAQELKSLKNELRRNPDILSITIAHPNTFNNEGSSGGFNWMGKKAGEDVMFHFLAADVDYARTFQLQIKDGRYFSSEFPTDGNAAVINETAAKIIGFKNPIGETLTTSNGSQLHIIGVVKDFHFQSLHFKIEPLIMRVGDDNNIIIKMKPDKITSTIEYVGKVYKSFNPGLPLNFHFLDDDFDNLYQSEKRIGKIFGYFSILAIIISCLGLSGLSSYMIERRIKEIGIRKTNGARSVEVFLMLTREYFELVIISVLAIAPFAWFAIQKWLQTFAYRINEACWTFVFSGLIVLFITMLTIGYQSYKAASKNPVEALRYE